MHFEANPPFGQSASCFSWTHSVNPHSVNPHSVNAQFGRTGSYEKNEVIEYTSDGVPDDQAVHAFDGFDGVREGVDGAEYEGDNGEDETKHDEENRRYERSESEHRIARIVNVWIRKMWNKFAIVK